MNGAVYSMTGFATGANALGASHVITLDIRSVNSRFLDLSFKLPDNYRHLEAKLRVVISSQIKRGKCEVRLNDAAPSQSTSNLGLSTQRIQSVLAQQSAIQDLAPSASPLSIAEIMTLASDKASVNTQIASDEQVLTLAEDVLRQLMAARQLEGSKLAQTMLDKVNLLRKLQREVASSVPAMVEQQRQKFLQKFTDALAADGGKITASVAQERALSEATAFAIRVDVTEEVERLESHLAEIENTLLPNKTAPQEIGKRLEFLIQELHREANTLGSKSATVATTKIAVEMKVLIEQLREQVQNIE